METKTTEVQEYLKNPNENTPNLKDYTTIKTYDDACAALGEKVDEVALTNTGVPKHIIALMKLELVCKALWGGEVKVYPYPNGNRCYYYPWFALYTKDEVERMDSKKRGRFCLLIFVLRRMRVGSIRVGGLQVRIVVPRSLIRTVDSVCALIHTKRQYILEHVFGVVDRIPRIQFQSWRTFKINF